MSRISVFCFAVALSVCTQVAWGVAAEQPDSPRTRLDKSLQSWESLKTTCGGNYSYKVRWTSWAGFGHETEVPVQERWSGSYCGVPAAGRHVVRDADAWKALWGKINRIRRPAPAPPEVAFDKRMAVAVFMGQRNSGGYSIRINSVRDSGQEVIVRVKQTSPPPGAIVTMALTQPYDVVTIAKTSKPIKFENATAGKRLPKAAKGFEIIAVRQSGGFAGVSNYYLIRADGSFEFKRSRPRKSVKGKLSEKDMAALSLAAGRQDWTKVPGKLLTRGAADLFMYDITLNTRGKAYRVVCDDLSVSKYPALKAILRALAAVRSGKPRGAPAPLDK